MLYISDKEYCNDDTWYVFDTDDCSESPASLEELTKAIQLGLTIYGVEVIVGAYGVPSIKSVSPYRPEPEYTSKLARLKALYGIDMHIHRGTLLNIEFTSCKIPVKCRIRLSDYASDCGSRITAYGDDINGEITLVVDDKIKVHRETFFGAIVRDGLIIDFTEASDESAMYIYHAICRCFLIDKDVRERRFIDLNARFNLYYGTQILEFGYSRDSEVPAAVNEVILRLYKKWFLSLFASKLQYPSPIEESDKWQQILRLTELRLCSHLAFWRSYSDDFDSVFTCFKTVIFDVGQYLGWNPDTAMLVKNFVTYFSLDEELEQAYVDMCNRVANYLLDMYGA